MNDIRVAVLMTCHNRAAQTIECLKSLEQQNLPASVTVRVFLVDDGSTDGTATTVMGTYPEVEVVAGSGSLYWTGGMALAHDAAAPWRPDYYLLLNDDVALFATAMVTLLDAAYAGDLPAIVVGGVADPATGLSSYGGVRAPDRTRPLRFVLQEPTGEVEPVDAMNGNVVLVPREVMDALGGLDRSLSHNMADLDLGLRARRAGFPVLLARQHCGTCAPNIAKSGWQDPAAPLAERWQQVTSVKGLPPREWVRFTRRHGGWRWPAYAARPYLRAAMPRVFGRRS